MCYTAIPGKTGCLATRDVLQMPKPKKSAALKKKTATPGGKSCGRTTKGKTLSWGDERDKYSRMDQNAKAKCAKRNQHCFKHARKEVARMKHTICI